MFSSSDEEHAMCITDNDIFPGCEFDEHLNLVSIFDPKLSVPLTDPFNKDNFGEEKAHVSKPSTESDTGSVSADSPSDHASTSYRSVASSHSAESVARRLDEVARGNDVDAACAHSLAPSLESLGLGYPTLRALRRRTSVPAAFHPRASLTAPTPPAPLTALKGLAHARAPQHALARWRAEKRAMHLRAAHAQEARRQALAALMESTEEIFMGMKAAQARRRRRAPTSMQRTAALDGSQSRMRSLHAMKRAFEVKKRRHQEMAELALKRQRMQQVHLEELQRRLEKEFRSTTCARPSPTDPTHGKERRQSGEGDTRLPAIASQEAKGQAALALAEKVLANLPPELQSPCPEPPPASSQTPTPAKLLPIPKRMPMFHAVELVHPSPHPCLQVSPASFSLSRCKPKLTLRFTNTSDTVLRVAVLPLDLELESLFTLSSSHTLSLAKGISISTHISLNLEKDAPLRACTADGLRLSVNGDIYSWPLQILADAFLPKVSHDRIEFAPNEYKQVFDISNEGTIAGEIQLRCHSPCISCSPEMCCIVPGMHQKITLVREKKAPLEEVVSLSNACSSSPDPTKENLPPLSMLTLFSPSDSEQTALFELPIICHESEPSLSVQPLEAEFFYCPTTAVVMTQVVLETPFNHGVRFVTHSSIEGPHPEHFKLTLNPDIGVIQVGAPMTVQIQLACIDPTHAEVASHLRCRVVFRTEATQLTYTLHGHFFNPAFQITCAPLRWPAMSVFETYEHAIALTNPTPVVMELGLTHDLAGADVHFAPLDGASLLLAPGQTARGVLVVRPTASGPLSGTVRWRNGFGASRTLQLRTHVFQPFARFPAVAHSLPPVSVGNAARTRVPLEWVLNARERRGVAQHPEEHGTFTCCAPERVLRDGQPCTAPLPGALPPLRIFPAHGELAWGARYTLHVAFAPTKFPLDPGTKPKPGSPAEPPTEPDTKTATAQPDTPRTRSKKLFSPTAAAESTAAKANGSGTRRPFSSKTTSQSVASPPSEAAAAASAATTATAAPTFQTCVEVFRVPVLFTLLQRSKTYGVDDRPSRSVAFLYFQTSTLTTLLSVSTRLVEFGPVPVGFHGLQTLHVTNHHVQDPLTLRFNCPPTSPFVLMSALRPIPPKSMARILLGFYPASMDQKATHQISLATPAFECLLKLTGTGMPAPVTLSGDTGDAWVPLVQSFGHLLLNEPGTVTLTFQNASSQALPAKFALEAPTTPPWLDCAFPETLASKSATQAHLTCAATRLGTLFATCRLFALGLGYRTLHVDADVHGFTAFCAPAHRDVAMQCNSETQWQVRLPKRLAAGPPLLEFRHVRPTNLAGIKLDAKKPCVATFLRDAAECALDMAASVPVEMGKTVALARSPTAAATAFDPFTIQITGGLDLTTKKVVANDVQILYRVQWVD